MPPTQYQGRQPAYPVASSVQPGWSVAPQPAVAPAHVKLSLPPPPSLPAQKTLTLPAPPALASIVPVAHDAPPARLTLPSPAELGIKLGASGPTAVVPPSATP
jgi:hypothetical protein